MFTIHLPPVSTSTNVTFRCAPSKYQNSGPRALVSDVQQPSPNFFQVFRVRSAKPASGQGHMPPA
jgi:hypothetical protein